MAAGHVTIYKQGWERNCTGTHQTEEIKDASDEEAGKDSKLRPLSESEQKNTYKVR